MSRDEKETPNTVELLIENAVLRSATAFRQEMNIALAGQHEKTEKLVISLHANYVDDVKKTNDLAQNALNTAQANEKKLTNLWARVIALTTSASVVGGFLGFAVAQMIH